MLNYSKSASAFILAAACGAGAGCGGGGTQVELTFNPQEATIRDVRTSVKTGIVSCRALVDRYQLLHDSLDPTFRAVISWNDHLQDDANRLDRIPSGQRGSLHCVPIVVKDNLNFAGLPTTGGAQALAGVDSTNNADAVQRMLTAGAIVLGKTNMPDFATDGTNTLSSFGGQTVNPYNRTLTVYGSSGGTAAAISASLGVVGLGTDTYGSLVLPANATGLVAIRPTQGLVPGTGILPLMSLQDMAGPMARTVEDAAAVLELLVDAQYASKGSQSYTSNLNSDALRGLTIGFDAALLQPQPAPPSTPSPEVTTLFNSTLSDLTQAGAKTKQVDALMTLFPPVLNAADLSFKCMPVDFKQSLNDYLKRLRPELTPKSLTDIIATGEYLSTVKGFLMDADAKTDTIQSSPDCQQYLTAKAAAASAITAFMDSAGLDLLIYPAANQPAFAFTTPPPAGWVGFQALSSVSGLPSLTMPMDGTTKNGAPVGFILLARPYQEAKLVQAAYAFQSQFHPRRTPDVNLP